MKIVVGITGASGAIYARLVLECLLACPDVEYIYLVYSDTAREVVAFEGETMPEDARIGVLDNADLFAPIASGSSRCDAMIVVPCSVGTLGRIACGTAQTLMERAADVMLKERRRLVLVVRESPYSLLHLRNMVAVTEAGGIIVPASPSFYSRPSDIEELCMSVAERALTLAGAGVEHFEWNGRE
ncbi:MAG: UbiX family flavin prenyltransferase [Alistipes sp.]|nr:UbiX family flavin prenyltransferase [Alistipes sp.]